MDRRNFLGAALGAAAACGLPGAKRELARGTERPNLLLIMADDLGYGDLGFTGRTDYATPAIDRLARDGVTLTQAYSIAPVCTPTRVGLMTGRYPARLPLGLYEPLTVQTIGLPAHPPTLPLLLSDAGYRTALVGKWHLGTTPEFHPLRHFDEFFGFTDGAVDYASHVGIAVERPDLYDGEQRVAREGYLTDLLSTRAVEFIEGAGAAPFFLNLQYSAPHWPWQAPGDPPYPDSLRWRGGGSAATYAAMMRSLDDGVARVLDALRRGGLERDTLVVFTSDNGGERYSDMGPFRHSKMSVWEGGIRVAAAARWPAALPAGTRCDQVCTTLDWTATFLAAARAHADPAASLDGIDIRPQLAGAAPVRRELFWRVHQRLQQKAVRSGDWKLIDDQDGRHLFNLANDPGEAHDRSREQPERALRLAQALEAWEATMLPPIPLNPAER